MLLTPSLVPSHSATLSLARLHTIAVITVGDEGTASDENVCEVRLAVSG